MKNVCVIYNISIHNCIKLFLFNTFFNSENKSSTYTVEPQLSEPTGRHTIGLDKRGGFGYVKRSHVWPKNGVVLAIIGEF